MFFSRRSTQAENFDLPGGPPSETLAAYRELDRLNRFCLFARPFQIILPHWLGNERCARLEILDVGAGTGLLGRQLTDWARRRHWDWHFTNLDVSPFAAQLNDSRDTITDSALALPFPADSFDLVVASQMTHHLTDEEVAQHLREARRVTRDAILISDVHRNAGLYAMLWLSTLLLGIRRTVRADALLSVRRGFHLGELRRLAAQAGLVEARVWLCYGARIMLQARKSRVCHSLSAEAPSTPTPELTRNTLD